MRVRARITAVGMTAFLPLVASGCGPTWQSELVSVRADGTTSGNHYSTSPTFSPDGTKILFESGASDLGPTASAGQGDVYVRDLTTATTSLVSVRADGTRSGNGLSHDASFSRDGTRVVFTSGASDLVAGDTNGEADVFVRDLAAGVTTLVSANASGTNGGNGNSYTGTFSPDGSVVFHSRATDLGQVDTNGQIDLYRRDLNGATALISVNAAGTDSANHVSTSPTFSPDGTKIGFISRATDLGPTDTNLCPDSEAGPGSCGDVYLRDLTAGVTSLVSTSAAGGDAGNAPSGSPTFSPDGTRIAFVSAADNLGPLDTNGTLDVFVRDLTTHETELVSVNVSGTDSGSSYSGTGPVRFTPDSDKILFAGNAQDLVSTETSGLGDVFLRDLGTETTTLVTMNAAGTGGGNGWTNPWALALSNDGTKVAFASDATNFGPTDSDTASDLYVRDLVANKTGLVSANADGSDSANGLWSIGPASFNADGTLIAFVTEGDNLGPVDANQTNDVYLARPR